MLRPYNGSYCGVCALDDVVRRGPDADGAEGRVALRPVQALAVQLAVPGGDLEGVVRGDAGAEGGQGRVALNPVAGVSGKGGQGQGEDGRQQRQQSFEVANFHR